MSKFFVYIIELDIEVSKLKKFRLKNPNYLVKSKCFYVGQTSRRASLRFEEHKEGYKANKYARIYGIQLRYDLFEKYNPIPTRKDAIQIERMLALELRKKQFGVWYNQ